MGTGWLENHTVSPGFSRADADASDNARFALLYRTCFPYRWPNQFHGETILNKEETTLPEACADVSWFV